MLEVVYWVDPDVMCTRRVVTLEGDSRSERGMGGENEAREKGGGGGGDSICLGPGPG